MICYRCGMSVGKTDNCPSCGADLHMFQKAMRISNLYYNDGLQKANVRNLSGAIISLKAALKLNKYHIDARNLLGLVYYEMGETVDALGEWVISNSYQPDDNRANEYLEAIKKNQAQLGVVNQTIKKYNQALLYCRQDSRDLAIIQLKKVLSLNPKLVKGHQLLALLYMQEGRYEQAKKSLRNAGKIDTDNTTTLRYLKEVNARLQENRKNQKPKQDDLISYQSGNETIIMPKRFKESSLGETLGYIVLGLVIGVAVTNWLIVPNVKKGAQSSINQQLLAANDTISTNNQTIKSLEDQIEELNAQIASAQDDSKEVEAHIASYEKLLEAYDAYVAEDILASGNAIQGVVKEDLNESSRTIYENLESAINEQYLNQLYEQGYEHYNNNEFEEAAEILQTVVDSEIGYDEGYAAYYLAQSYRKLENHDAARTYYQYVIDHYPGTERAKTAKKNIVE